MPAKPAENRNVERLASANAGTRSSPSSTTGAGWRAERRRNTAPSTRATENASATRASQSHAGPCASPSVSRPTAAMSSATPGRSGRRVARGSRISGTTRSAKTAASTPSGTLTRKIQRQLASTSRPPSGGASEAPTAPMAAHAPITGARRSGGNSGSTSPSEFGVSAAAPIPCSTRAPTSAPTEGATAHRAEPSVKSASPPTNIRRPPDDHPPPAVEVPQLPGRDQDGGEDDRVRGQDPREPRQARAAEVAAQVRERDVDDEEGEDREEDGEGDEGEHGPRVRLFHAPSLADSGCFMQQWVDARPHVSRTGLLHRPVARGDRG